MAQSVTKRLASLFRGLERAHGTYELLKRKAGGAKVKGRALTVREPVTDELWEGHLQGKQGLGIVPIRDDATCRFGAIDIDKYDVRIDEVEQKVATMGLPLLPTRTKSGGVHLYVFGAEDLEASLLKKRLDEWAIAIGFGGSEIFPKQSALANERDVGNWINMPYFGAVPTGKTDRYGIFKGQPLTLEEFIKRAEKLRITNEQLEALAPKLSDEFAEGPPCLQSLALSGFPQGTRNNGLFAVAVYLKKRFPDDFESHLHAYNVQFMTPPLGQAEVALVLKSVKKKDYGYPCEKTPCSLYCNKSVCKTREFGVGRGLGDWDVVLDSDVQRVMTDPPYWIIGVNGVRMEFRAEELMSQRVFSLMILNRLGFIPTTLPADKWRAEINKLTMAATDVEAPADAGTGGELEYHLQQFCTVFPQAETKEELLTGKPWIAQGIVHFRAADFKQYLESKHFRALTGTRLYSRLRSIGLTHKQLWLGGEADTTNIAVWCVPSIKSVNVTVPPRQGEKGGM